ncbi:hypothetical protein [Flavisphingomonas formosensis]|uniref:hypothetical protein n=1 Tax=Flavisphingomonas formosensis TaxID=861534 RepID=UPI0012FBA0BD|nr:hypothetical protein [Sphingomonas formosensis]
MSRYQPTATELTEIADAGERIARLHGMLAAVERLGECASGSETPDKALDEAARLSMAYADAPTVARRRFDALADDTAFYADAGVSALMRIRGSEGTPAAARLLANELRRSIQALVAILEPRRQTFSLCREG